MVKTTRRTIQGANLRQVIRPKIGKKVSLRQIIRDPLTKHTNINVQNNFSLRTNSINNKILSSTSHLSKYKEFCIEGYKEYSLFIIIKSLFL